MIRSGKVADPWYGKAEAIKAEGKPAKPAIATPTIKALPPAKEAVKKQVKLPSPDTAISFDDLNEMLDRLEAGDITPEEIQNNWERFKGSREAIAKDLNGRYTLEQLKKEIYAPYGKKKSDYIDRWIDHLEMQFNPDDSLSHGIGKGERQKALDAKVKKWTPEKIQAIADKKQQAIADKQSRIEKQKKALDNPETLEEFDFFAKYKKEENLTPEQAEKYDELKALAGRETRKQREEADRQKELKAREVAETGFGLVEGYHSKRDQPLFTVTMGDRVGREDFDSMKAIAKEFEGFYYKAYKGTPAGFQFPNADKAKAEANAKGFIDKAKQFLGGETVTTTTGKDPGTKTNAAADRLRELAATTRERAESELSRGGLRNTERRARMGANKDDGLREDIALADTMDNLAEAIAGGETKFLDRIKTKADVKQLDSMVKQAHYNAYHAWTKENPNAPSSQREDKRTRPAELSDIAYADRAGIWLYSNQIRSLAEEIKDVPGLKLVAARMAKRVKNIAPDAWERMGLTDRQGIADMAKIKQVMGGKKTYGVIDRALEEFSDYKRLEGMGLTNDAEVRSALREFMTYRGKKGQEDPITKMEREMIGRKIPGYFPTPKSLAVKVAVLAGIEDGDRLLEPSAGKGSLLDAVRDLGKDIQITAIEQNGDLSNILKAKGYDVDQGDFLLRDGEYDKIVMNPPFENGQDMDHVQHAYDLLAPGGRLVAITGAHWTFGEDKKSREFRDWLDDQDSTYEKLPDGSFKDSDNSTGVSTWLVEINKPGKVDRAKAKQVDGDRQLIEQEYGKEFADKYYKGIESGEKGVLAKSRQGQVDRLLSGELFEQRRKAAIKEKENQEKKEKMKTPEGAFGISEINAKLSDDDLMKKAEDLDKRADKLSKNSDKEVVNGKRSTAIATSTFAAGNFRSEANDIRSYVWARNNPEKWAEMEDKGRNRQSSQPKADIKFDASQTLKGYAFQQGVVEPVKGFFVDVSPAQANSMSRNEVTARAKKKEAERKEYRDKMDVVKKEFAEKTLQAYEGKAFDLFDAYKAHDNNEGVDTTTWDVLVDKFKEKGIDIPSPFSLTKLNNNDGISAVKSKLKSVEDSYFDRQSSQPKSEKDRKADGFANDIPKEVARQAYVWNSMRPDVAAEQAIASYSEAMETDLAKFKSLGAESDFADHRANYKEKYVNWLKSRHGVMSSAISGNARFNAKKSESASNNADSLKADLDDYRKQSLLAIEKKANPEKFAVKKGDNAELETLTKKYTALKADIDRSILGNQILKENKGKPQENIASILKLNGFTDKEIDNAFIPLGQGQPLGFAVKSKGNLNRYKKRIEELGGDVSIQSSQSKSEKDRKADEAIATLEGLKKLDTSDAEEQLKPNQFKVNNDKISVQTSRLEKEDLSVIANIGLSFENKKIWVKTKFDKDGKLVEWETSKKPIDPKREVQDRIYQSVSQAMDSNADQYYEGIKGTLDKKEQALLIQSTKPEPTKPKATPEPAIEGTPRAIAAKAAKDNQELDDEYEFDRKSAVPNRGRDVKGSARHKMNAWRGLAEAESDGTAVKMLKRDNLLKLEPHSLMVTIKPSTAPSHLTMFLALKKFPATPFNEKDLAEYRRYTAGKDQPRRTEKELRQEYYDAYLAVKKAVEDNAGIVDTHVAIGNVQKTILDLIDKYQEKREHYYDPVVTQLKSYSKKLGAGYYSGKSSAWGESEAFAKAFKKEHPWNNDAPTEEKQATLDLLQEYVSQIIEGESMNSVLEKLGKEVKKPRRFNAAEAYVNVATRKGGRVIDAKTIEAQADYLMKDVGFDGLQFGKTVTDPERAHHQTKLVESVMDLADILGLPDNFISLGGTLSIGLGSRGVGSALAHYEPVEKIINLTRKNGVGSLAHEWGHAMDNYLGGGASFLTELRGTPSTDVQQKMSSLISVSNKSAYRDRLLKHLQQLVNDQKMSAKQANGYWLSKKEVFARTFERYVQFKLEDQGRENTYLAGYNKEKNDPLWPNDDEMKELAPVFDDLFDAVRKAAFAKEI